MKKRISVFLSIIIIMTNSIGVFASEEPSKPNSSKPKIESKGYSNEDIDRMIDEMFEKANTNMLTITSEDIVNKGLLNSLAYTGGSRVKLNYYRDNDFLVATNMDTGVQYSCYVNNSYVGYGYDNNSGAVGCIQGLLNCAGAALDVDGLFGNNTYNAIVNFQNAYNARLSVDGVAGPSTFAWAILIVFEDSISV